MSEVEQKTEPSFMQSGTLDKMLPDLVSLQGELPNVSKDAENPHFKSRYADLANVCETLRPLLLKHNFAVTHQCCIEAGGPVLITTLWHKSGQYLRAVSSIAPEKQTFQGVGSAITYTRRYDLMALVGLAPEDDDGHAAGAKQQQRRQPKSNGAPPAKPPGINWGEARIRGIKAARACDTIEACAEECAKIEKWMREHGASDDAYDAVLRAFIERFDTLVSEGKGDPGAAAGMVEVISGRLRSKTPQEDLQEQAKGTF